MPATMRGMRYAATVLALFMVATAAAAQEWGDEARAELQPIELRASQLPAETPAMLLDLKASPAVPSRRPNPVAAPASAATAKAQPKPRPHPSVTVAAAATRKPALGAAPAPAPAPIAIAPTNAAEDNDDDDDSDDDSGGGDD